MWITYPSTYKDNQTQKNYLKNGKSSQIWDTYLESDSIRSEILIFRPFARSSSVSAVGDVFPFMILLIVDFDTPVRTET